MLLVTLDESSLGYLLTGKAVIVTTQGRGIYRAGKGKGKDVACSRDNLPKVKDGAYIMSLDEYSDVGTHWVALYVLISILLE